MQINTIHISIDIISSLPQRLTWLSLRGLLVFSLPRPFPLKELQVFAVLGGHGGSPRAGWFRMGFPWLNDG